MMKPRYISMYPFVLICCVYPLPVVPNVAPRRPKSAPRCLKMAARCPQIAEVGGRAEYLVIYEVIGTSGEC